MSSEKPFSPNAVTVEVTAHGVASEAKRVLDPMERIMEILCGLIMVLTFTLTTAVSGRSEIRSMLIGALGCNLAWGIVDGVLYLMGHLSGQGRSIRLLKAVRAAADPETAHRIIADVLPPALVSVLTPANFEAIRHKLNQIPEPPMGPKLTKEGWRGAAAIFLLVFLSTLPVVIPFAFMTDVRLAQRFSNLIAIMMLFLTGYAYGRYAGFHPALMGLSMVLFGSVLVGITIALGG